MISGIYTITNLFNNKIYVGYTINLRARRNEHFSSLRNNKHTNIYLQRAYNKYGEHNLVYEILEECSIEFLSSQENYWCNLLNVHNKKFGYNIKPTNPNKVGGHSKETRIKISNTHTGKTIPEITRQKISNTNSGKYYGTRDKIVFQYDLQGNFLKKWDNTREASVTLNINKGAINLCCNKITITSGGYHWTYQYQGQVIKSIISQLYIRTKKVKQLTMNGDLIKIWNSVSEASINMTGRYSGIISNCINNKCKSAYGFKWEKYE